MLAALVVVLRSLALICGGHRAVALENLALSQQLAVIRRTGKRPQLRYRDRLFWMLLTHAWRDWRTALIVGQPDTVVRWHRQWLRRLWTRRSARVRPGRPSTNTTVRTLVIKIAAANPLWGAPRIHGELHTLGRRGFGANRLQACAAATSAAVADMANLPNESRRRARLDRFLYRANRHGASPVCVRRPSPPPPANRSFQRHETSDSCP